MVHARGILYQYPMMINIDLLVIRIKSLSKIANSLASIPLISRFYDIKHIYNSIYVYIVVGTIPHATVIIPYMVYRHCWH